MISEKDENEDDDFCGQPLLSDSWVNNFHQELVSVLKCTTVYIYSVINNIMYFKCC